MSDNYFQNVLIMRISTISMHKFKKGTKPWKYYVLVSEWADELNFSKAYFQENLFVAITFNFSSPSLIFFNSSVKLITSVSPLIHCRINLFFQRIQQLLYYNETEFCRCLKTIQPLSTLLSGWFSFLNFLV